MASRNSKSSASRNSRSSASRYVETKVKQSIAEKAQESNANKRARGDIEYDEHRSSSEADRVTLLMEKLKQQYDTETNQMLELNDTEREEFQIRVYYLIDAVDRLTIVDEANNIKIIQEANKFIDKLPEDMTKAAKSVLKSSVNSIGKRVRARAQRAITSEGGGHYKLKRYGKTRRRYGKARRTRKTR